MRNHGCDGNSAKVIRGSWRVGKRAVRVVRVVNKGPQHDAVVLATWDDGDVSSSIGSASCEASVHAVQFRNLYADRWATGTPNLDSQRYGRVAPVSGQSHDGLIIPGESYH